MRLSIFQTGLLIILALSASAGWSQDQTVSVNGYEVRVWTSGLEQRRPEQPVIVFENGSSSSLDSWGDFREAASQLGPVLFYDRATVGRSEWDGKVGTPDHVTARLWSLLSHLEIEPPYVLVGWSWGADLAIQHARSHADDVVGIVLIDPPLHSGVAELEILKTLGISSSAHNATIARMQRELDSVPDVVRADVQPILTIYEEVSDPEINLPPHIRVVALVAGKRPDPPAEAISRFGPFPYDFQSHLAAKTQLRIERLLNMVSAAKNGALFVLPNEGHALHINRPDLVAAGIEYAVGE